jgi:hypothetical protein
MNIQMEDALHDIIKLQDEEVSYRINQFNLGKSGEIDNSDRIKEIIESNGLNAEFNSDPDVNLKTAFIGLVQSGFFSKRDLKMALKSERPLDEIFKLVYGRAYEGSAAQVFYNWESRGSRGFDPLDRSIRHLYLFLEEAAFRFKFDYGIYAPIGPRVSNKSLPPKEGVKAKVHERVQSVWLSTNPSIDLSVHRFPEEGDFGHLHWNERTSMPHRRNFELYPNEDLLIPHFDARLLELGRGHYVLHNLELGYFGSKEKYVDRCLNLLYQMLTQKGLPQEKRRVMLPPIE